MVQKADGERTHCIRCGECCMGSSPTLQAADVSNIMDGSLERRNLYTIRAGELVHDNIHHVLKVADSEMIKFREMDNKGGCIYYDESARACRIYEHRPVQCRALACWDENEFLAVYGRPKSVRRDIIQDDILLALIAEHDKRCSYRLLEDCVKQIEPEGERAVERILEIMKFDYHFRPFVSEKVGIDLKEMDFFFGRPLIHTIKMFGLEVIREPDGSFCLTVCSRP